MPNAPANNTMSVNQTNMKKKLTGPYVHVAKGKGGSKLTYSISNAAKKLDDDKDGSKRGSGAHISQYRSQYRVLDDAARSRRHRQMLDKLEKDNFHEDPHANLVMHKKAPKFEDQAIKLGSSNVNSGPGRRPGSHSHHYHKSRQVTIASLLEEDSKMPPPSYTTAVAPAPGKVTVNDKVIFIVTKRHFCCVCGFNANYTCVACGMRYCCVTCLQTHRDTRCLKWTA
ncbi:zinc finger HIT domain-containing protein 1 [Tetranychus urticae]|uniref:HIT-type domain-containing protein n=1 Tax=Tetranychus urticae TaxID=32264 RepID=T1KCE1_TETUR|nr:zinc finger HIT domain-containing protein 1 [Tetranychus urticae]